MFAIKCFFYFLVGNSAKEDLLLYRGNSQVLIFCQLLPLLVKIDAASFENMTNYFLKIIKNSFRDN